MVDPTRTRKGKTVIETKEKIFLWMYTGNKPFLVAK